MAGDTTNFSNVFVRDTLMGTTILVSVNTNNIDLGNGDLYSPMISPDGRYVVFHSKATSLAGGVSGAGDNIFLRDVPLVTLALTTQSSFSTPTSMTADGRYNPHSRSPAYRRFYSYTMCNWVSEFILTLCL